MSYGSGRKDVEGTNKGYGWDRREEEEEERRERMWGEGGRSSTAWNKNTEDLNHSIQFFSS